MNVGGPEKLMYGLSGETGPHPVLHHYSLQYAWGAEGLCVRFYSCFFLQVWETFLHCVCGWPALRLHQAGDQRHHTYHGVCQECGWRCGRLFQSLVKILTAMNRTRCLLFVELLTFYFPIVFYFPLIHMCQVNESLGKSAVNTVEPLMDSLQLNKLRTQ